jgi:MFS family permease
MATSDSPPAKAVHRSSQDIEKTPNVSELQDHGVYGFTTSVDELPKGYYKSAGFIGTFAAVAMSQSAAAGGFSLIGPILAQIDEDLGPDPNILWLALVYTLCLGIGLLLVGRITDICGRRWFFVGASFLALIGSIVSATAKTIPVLIGGQTLISLGACGGLSFGTSLGELVPIKYRFMVVGAMFIGGMPTVGLGAGIATAFVLYTGPQWRWCYWLLTIMNGVGTLLWFFFYHPPTFLMKQGNKRRMAVIKNFDYIGALLFVAGLLLFLMGLSWGGSAYPWKSAHVISTIVIGFLCLVALFIYEIYAPARLLQEPLIPRHLLKNRDFMFTIILLGFGASVYYAFALVWPQMVATVYNHHGLMTNGWVSCIVGIALAAGQLSGGFLAEKIGHVKYQCNVAMAIAGITLACKSRPSYPRMILIMI